jgi:hypothetical protein
VPNGDFARLEGVFVFGVFVELRFFFVATFPPVGAIVKVDAYKTNPKHRKEATTRLMTGCCVIISSIASDISLSGIYKYIYKYFSVFNNLLGRVC